MNIREQFEAWSTDNRKLGDMELLFAWSAWQAASKTKDEEIEQLKTKLAMCEEVAEEALSGFKCTQTIDDYPSGHWSRLARGMFANNANEQTVTAWRKELEARAIDECVKDKRFETDLWIRTMLHELAVERRTK